MNEMIKSDYKYQLDKSSRKYECPKCGRKTFVLYLDENGEALDENVGRCDRLDKCQYHYSPKDYFRDTNNAPDVRKRNNPLRPRKNEAIPPSFCSPDDMIPTIRGYERNSLMKFLHGVFDSHIGSDNVNRIAVEYAVGTSQQFGGSPIFWLIDNSGRIRAGKVMGYNPADGKRVKNPRPQMQWIHSLLKEKYPDYRLQQCYFGAHKLRQALKHTEKINKERQELNISGRAEPTVWLLESEKACLIVAMALAWGGMENVIIPIACGGCGGFKPYADKKRDSYDAVQLLRNRKVVLFPDNGKFDEWKEKAIGLQGFAKEVYISTVMERSLHPHQIECVIEEGDGFDDVILRYINEGKEVANLLLNSYGYKGNYRIV
ncbi:MAG: hypothetical protein K2M45_01215 [Muribaculaceae bacterium]|nr:hypothetical protein [Muribaculaceae bacterium]